jgi:hypothetical protein
MHRVFEEGGGKPEAKRRRWKDDMKMDLREMGCRYGLDSSGIGQEPVAVYCEHGNWPAGSINFVKFLSR